MSTVRNFLKALLQVSLVRSECFWPQARLVGLVLQLYGHRWGDGTSKALRAARACCHSRSLMHLTAKAVQMEPPKKLTAVQVAVQAGRHQTCRQPRSHQLKDSPCWASAHCETCCRRRASRRSSTFRGSTGSTATGATGAARGRRACL